MGWKSIESRSEGFAAEAEPGLRRHMLSKRPSHGMSVEAREPDSTELQCLLFCLPIALVIHRKINTFQLSAASAISPPSVLTSSISTSTPASLVRLLSNHSSFSARTAGELNPAIYIENSSLTSCWQVSGAFPYEDISVNARITLLREPYQNGFWLSGLHVYSYEAATGEIWKIGSDTVTR